LDLRAPKRIGEIGVVENIEELGADLGRQPFLELEYLGYGHIPVLEPRITARDCVPMYRAFHKPEE
jgi:hypothetical protein